MFDPSEPFYLQWHITDRCNLKCRHCYRDAPKPELPAADLDRILAGFLELRRRMPQEHARVQVAGGEPFLSEQLYRVLEKASAAGLQTRILTNGTLIDRAAAAAVKKAGCGFVQISIEGSRAVHEAIRGPGSFDQALAGARRLREVGVPVTFAMTLSKQTAPELPAVLALAKEHADRVGFHRLVPCGKGEGMAAELLSPEELCAAFVRILEFKRSEPGIEVPLRDPLWRPFLDKLEFSPVMAGCSAAFGGVCVESDGTVYACRRMPMPVGNAARTPLAELWDSAGMRGLRDRAQLKGRCGRCAMRGQCGGCRAVAWACTGDPMAEDPQCMRRPTVLDRMYLWTLARAFPHREEPGGGG